MKAKKILKAKQTIHVGESVQSNYSSRWKGIVLKTADYKINYPKIETGYVCSILILKDQNGNVPTRRIVRHLNQNWLTKIEALNIENVNKDWF